MSQRGSEVLPRIKNTLVPSTGHEDTASRCIDPPLYTSILVRRAATDNGAEAL